MEYIFISNNYLFFCYLFSSLSAMEASAEASPSKVFAGQASTEHSKLPSLENEAFPSKFFYNMLDIRLFKLLITFMTLLICNYLYV